MAELLERDVNAMNYTTNSQEVGLGFYRSRRRGRPALMVETILQRFHATSAQRRNRHEAKETTCWRKPKQEGGGTPQFTVQVAKCGFLSVEPGLRLYKFKLKRKEREEQGAFAKNRFFWGYRAVLSRSLPSITPKIRAKPFGYLLPFRNALGRELNR